MKQFESLTSEIKAMIVVVFVIAPFGFVATALSIIPLLMNLAFTVIAYNTAVSNRDQSDALGNGEHTAQVIVDTLLSRPLSFIESKLL